MTPHKKALLEVAVGWGIVLFIIGYIYTLFQISPEHEWLAAGMVFVPIVFIASLGIYFNSLTFQKVNADFKAQRDRWDGRD